MREQELDQARSEAFAEQMMGMLNTAAIVLATSIGHRIGLFDAMAELPPSTSAQIADAAGLHERYVREWLGAMAAGRLVEHNPDSDTYLLPPEHAAWLTRSVGPNNLALQMQYIPMLANAEDNVIRAFKEGGGIPYSAYPRMQQIMAEDSGTALDAGLVEVVLPIVRGLVERLRTGIDVLDVGCGSGHAVNLIAQAFPRSRVTGYDLSEEGITTGRKEAGHLGLDNAHFEVRDGATLDVSEQYDLITAFAAIHDLAQPDRALQGIARALRPDGTFLMVDFRASSRVGENLDNPIAPFMYTISTMHCVAVSLADGGAGLGAMWGEQKARQMLADAGFTNVDVATIEGDLFNNYYIATKR